VSGLKPYKILHPVKLEIRFNDVVIAELASDLPGVERQYYCVYRARHDRGLKVSDPRALPSDAEDK
jgi:hypothetical protein